MPSGASSGASNGGTDRVVLARRQVYAEMILAGKVDGQGVDKWRARAEVLAKAYLELLDDLRVTQKQRDAYWKNLDDALRNRNV